MADEYKKALLTDLSIIFGSILIAVFLSFLFLDRLDSHISEAVSLKKAARERFSMVESILRLKAESEEALVYEPKINSLLPSQDDLLDFPRFLMDEGKKMGLNINVSFSNSPVMPQPSQAGYIAFSIDVDGPYSILANFLDEIETGRKKFFIVLDKFDFSYSREDRYRLIGKGRVFFK